MIRFTCRYSKYLLNVHRLGKIYLAVPAIPPAHCALVGLCAVYRESCAAAVTHRRDIIPTQTVKRSLPTNPEERPGEDGSPVSSDSVPLEGLVFR